MWNTAERVVFTRDPYFLSYQIFINRKLYVCFKSDASSDLIYPGFQSHFYSDSTSLLSIILVLSPRSLHSNLFGWLFLTFVHSFHFTFILLLYDLRRGRKERRKRHRFTPVSSLSVTLYAQSFPSAKNHILSYTCRGHTIFVYEDYFSIHYDGFLNYLR